MSRFLEEYYRMDERIFSGLYKLQFLQRLHAIDF